MKSKSFLFFTILIFFISCNSKPSTKDALNYYENVLKNYSGIKKNTEELGILLKEYGLQAMNENNGTMDSAKLKELKGLNISIIKSIQGSQKNISAIPEFNSNSNLKAASLKYLNENLEIEQNEIHYFISIFDDGQITANEAQKMGELKKAFTTIGSAGENFKNIQLDFYKEFGITDEQLTELNKKYGL